MIVIQYFFFLFIFLFTPNQSLIISETKIFENQNITIHNLTKAKYYFHINIVISIIISPLSIYNMELEQFVHNLVESLWVYRYI